MRDHGPVKSVLLKTLEIGSTILEPDDVFPSRSKESSAEDNRDGSPSSLLVEDVKVCDTCGNAGYEELLAVCSSCKEGAEHTYCMRIQMDSLPEGEWFCEMCRIKQRQGGCKTLERFLVPSKSFGRLTSIKSRSKPVSNQGGFLSRLVDRLNNKQPRITQVRNSPSKAPILPVKRSANDYLVTHASRKLAMESTSLATSSSLPLISPVLSPLAKPSRTRESTVKCTSETNKVRFLASSAVANIFTSAQATVVKPACVASQPLKAGQAGIKSRYASVSCKSESSRPSSQATSLNLCRALLTTSATPILVKSSSGKLSSDFSILTNSSTNELSAENSRKGNVTKRNGQSKNSRDGGVSDGGVSMPSSTEVLSCASQPSGSKFMTLGRDVSGGSTGEPRPFLDIHRLTLDYGIGAQRSGLTSELRPSSTSRPPVEHGRGTDRSGPGIGGSSVAGTGQDALNDSSKDKASSGFDQAFGVGSAKSRRVTLESVSVPAFLGMQSKSNTGVWSAPWLGDSSSMRCLLCKTVGHSVQDCTNRSAIPLRQKVVNGLSNSPPTSSSTSKNSVRMFSDVRPYDFEMGLESDLYGLAKSSAGSQLPIESVSGGCSVDAEKSRIVLLSRTSTGLVFRGSSNANINESLATGSKNPFLLVDAVFGPVPQVLQRVHSASEPRSPWLESLSPHSVQGQGPGHAGYPPRQRFPPSGTVIYSQDPPVPHHTPQPSPLLPPYAPPAPSPIQSRTQFLPGTQVDAAVPSAAIAWRGAFEVNDGQSTIVFDKILAHVSTKAVVKVHEVATSMPQQLRLEQVERATDLETWPRQFNIRPPTDGSIALYFFATIGESFEKFRHNLVDKMVARDLVLRGHVDDAELLIFPSNKLSEKFQRWHGHMFLWGVFRARKQLGNTASTSAVVVKGPLVAAATCFEASKISSDFVPEDAPEYNITLEIQNPNSLSSGRDNTGVVDMEVDLEGANECDMSDNPIKGLDNANPPLASRSPTGASMKSPIASAKLGSAPDYLVTGSDKADNVYYKSTSMKADSLDLPPGFSPGLALPSIPVAIEMLTSDSTVVRGSAKRIEVHNQVDLGSCADGDVDLEQVGSNVKRSMNYHEVAKISSTPQVSSLSASNPKEHAESHLPSRRPPTIKPSGSKSHSSIQAKEKERDNVRDRLCERSKDRETDIDTKYDIWDRSRERAWELHRDRDSDRDYEREKGRQRSRSRDGDRDLDSYDSSRKRGRTSDEDRAREKKSGRDRVRETVRDRQQERVREWERERPLDREKDRKLFRTRERDQVLDSRIRYRRSRPRSRTRSPRRKMRSRSPDARRWKTRSRTLPIWHKSRSSSPSRRYPASFRQPSVSGSDSPGSQSIEILQGSTIAGPRSWKLDRESMHGKRGSTLDKDVGGNGSRSSSRWKSARTVDDTRSGSAGGSNFKTVGKLEHSNTMLVSRSVTSVMDMDGGVCEAFSTDGATNFTSLPDLNNDSVESGIALHDFLLVDESGPSREPGKANLIAEQAFFPSATRAAVPLSLSTSLNFRSQEAEHTLARERWSFAVSSICSSRSDYTSRPYRSQLLRVPRSTNFVNKFSLDLELALGGRETSPEQTLPLPLFVDVDAGSTPDLGLALNAKSPDLRVSSSTPHQLGPSGMVCGGDTASLSLSLVVPHCRREGNSWVQVEGHGDLHDNHDVDFALTL